MGIATVEDRDGVICGKNNKPYPPTLRFFQDLGHDRQSTLCSGSDYQPVACPRNLLFDGEGRMAVGVAISLGKLLLPPFDLAPVDDQVMLIRHAVDSDRAERELVETHQHRPRLRLLPWASGGLGERHG